MRLLHKILLIIAVCTILLSHTQGTFAAQEITDLELASIYGGWGCDADCIDLLLYCPSELSEYNGEEGCIDGSRYDGGDCIVGCTGQWQMCSNWQWQYIYITCTDTMAECNTGWFGWFVGTCLGSMCTEGVNGGNAPSCDEVERPDC